VALRAIFVAYEGTSALSGSYEYRGATNLAFAAEQWPAALARSVPVVPVLVVFGAVLASVFAYGVLSVSSAETSKSRCGAVGRAGRAGVRKNLPKARRMQAKTTGGPVRARAANAGRASQKLSMKEVDPSCGSGT
jgi:hypothetical protein